MNRREFLGTAAASLAAADPPRRIIVTSGPSEQAAAEGDAVPTPDIHNICELCSFVSTDPRRAELLRRSVSHSGKQREVAVARLVELGEISSLAGLAGGDSA